MPLLDEFGREITTRRVTVRAHPAKHRRAKKPPAKRLPAANPSKPIELLLAARHNVGGVQYGPGPVKVPKDVADVLREGERRAAAADAQFMGTRACIIGPGVTKGSLRAREVSPEFFDTQHLNAVPFGVVDRNTGSFNPY